MKGTRRSGRGRPLLVIAALVAGIIAGALGLKPRLFPDPLSTAARAYRSGDWTHADRLAAERLKTRPDDRNALRVGETHRRNAPPFGGFHSPYNRQSGLPEPTRIRGPASHLGVDEQQHGGRGDEEPHDPEAEPERVPPDPPPGFVAGCGIDQADRDDQRQDQPVDLHR